MSNVTSTTDALSRTTNYDYDVFNRLVKITYPAADEQADRLFETIAYDAGGNVTSRTDTAGRLTNYAYDNVNRLISTTDAAGETTTFDYDELSRMTLLTDALNQRYQFVYDALGRQTSMTRAGVSMSYVYDAVGNRTQRTDYNGAVTNYTYDELNRLTTISYPDSSSATYGYDALSRMTSATNQNGTVSFSYDNRGRVSSTTDVWGKTIGYSYDANGNRMAMTIDGSGYATYGYDAVNRLTQIADSDNQVVSHNYDAVNKLTSRGLPNGVTTTYSYDGLDRLTRLLHAKGQAPLADNQYAYNPANQIAALTDGNGTRDFEYDAVDRLTSVTGAARESYTYDGVGNRLGDDASYAYDAFNRLTNRDSYTYSYDANGNETAVHYFQSQGRSFTYDFENRLTEVSSSFGRLVLHPPPPSVVHYKYDALGRRIERTGPNADVQRFVYDGQDVVADLDGNGNVVTTYLNGPGIDNKIRQSDATNGNLYFLGDHLGSTTALTDNDGNVAETTSYDSFGNSGGSAFTRYDYTGRERDPDTGLMYYRARWYDPQVGRFISEDPIGLDGGINLFAYVENGPIGDTDPFGLQKGRGPGHSVSLKRDPREWLERFKGRRLRNRGDSPGHDEQLRTRCRELEKWLFALTQVDMSQADLHRELMKQYDWCRRKFPQTCKGWEPAPAQQESPVPDPTSTQNRTWINDGIPRWDDGTPIDLAKYPEIYERARARRAGQFYIYPINPSIPNFAPMTLPIRPLIPLWGW